MILVVWENPMNVIDSVLSYFYEKYPVSTRYYLGRVISSAEIAKLTIPPLLQLGWLIIAPTSIKPTALTALDSGRAKNVCIVMVKNRKELDKVTDAFDSITYKVIDNHIVSKDKSIDWISKELVCDYKVAKYLYNRVHGNIKDLVSAVQTIKPLPKHDKATIEKYAVKNFNAGVSDIVAYLLGISSPYVKKSDIIGTVYNFRYAFSWLLNELQQSVKDYLTVFSLLSSGELDIDSYPEQKKLLKSNRLRHTPDWILKRLILAYGTVSTEYVFWLQTELSNIPKTQFGVIKLLQLLQIGG